MIGQTEEELELDEIAPEPFGNTADHSELDLSQFFSLERSTSEQQEEQWILQ